MSVVLGEAPETDDSEEEIIIPNSYKKISSNECTPAKINSKNVILKGEKVVDGHTHSNNETQDLIDAPVGRELTETYVPSEDTSPMSESLRRHLNDVSYRILNDFIQTTTQRASKELIEADELLLRSQITLQNASITIKNVNQKLNSVENSLKNMIEDDFIPNIKL